MIRSGTVRHEKVNTVLSLRARFADIKAFADGKLDLESFRAKTSGSRYINLAQENAAEELKKSVSVSINGKGW